MQMCNNDVETAQAFIDLHVLRLVVQVHLDYCDHSMSKCHDHRHF